MEFALTLSINDDEDFQKDFYKKLDGKNILKVRPEIITFFNNKTIDDFIQNPQNLHNQWTKLISNLNGINHKKGDTKYKFEILAKELSFKNVLDILFPPQLNPKLQEDEIKS